MLKDTVYIKYVMENRHAIDMKNMYKWICQGHIIISKFLCKSKTLEVEWQKCVHMSPIEFFLPKKISTLFGPIKILLRDQFETEVVKRATSAYNSFGQLCCRTSCTILLLVLRCLNICSTCHHVSCDRK